MRDIFTLLTWAVLVPALCVAGVAAVLWVEVALYDWWQGRRH